MVALGLHPLNVPLHHGLSVCAAARIQCRFSGLFLAVSQSESTDGRTRGSTSGCSAQLAVGHLLTHQTTSGRVFSFGFNVAF